MARATVTFEMPTPSYRGWGEVGRRISDSAGPEQTRVLRALREWPWRFRRAGHDRRHVAFNPIAMFPALCAVCRVYVGSAEDLDAAVDEPGFDKLFAPTIRVVEIQGDVAPSAKTLRSFHRAVAVLHRNGSLPIGPWPAIEGRVVGPLPPTVTRLGSRGPLTEALAWQLAHRPLTALSLDDHDPAVIVALAGGALQARVRRFHTGAIPVETVLAAGPWPSLERLGGPVENHDALIDHLGNAPRLVSLDLDVYPPLLFAALVDRGIRAIRLFVPAGTPTVPRPAGLRWFACSPELETGLAWSGY